MTKLETLLEERMVEAVGYLMQVVRDELAEQGHTLTGRLSRSIQADITVSLRDGIAKADVYLEDYGLAVNNGVAAGRIPYNPNVRTGAGTSKYIQGLISFFLKRGLTSENARGAAFATARKHAREGMPTRNSYRFSSNGRRTGFLEAAKTQEANAKFLEILKLSTVLGAILDEIVIKYTQN